MTDPQLARLGIVCAYPVGIAAATLAERTLARRWSV
jgi:hypothetical protein